MSLGDVQGRKKSEEEDRAPSEMKRKRGRGEAKREGRGKEGKCEIRGCMHARRGSPE